MRSHSIYVGSGTRRVDVGWRAAFDAGAGPTALWEDIFPGHPQYFAVGWAGGLDVHQARRDACDRVVAQS